MKEPSIQFINHASISIMYKGKSILCDPWYSGNVFNDGWSLLYENDDQKIEKLLNNINFIWISHEHPDHFSILFFKKFINIIEKNKIKVIFQSTRDKRVKSFLNKIGIKVIELEENQEYSIDDGFSIKIIKSEFYDSALIVKAGDYKIFNLNDCPIDNESELRKLVNQIGTCDILLTQFSYAAWKGGKNNLKWRKDAAINKLNTIYLQKKILEPKYIIPFASFMFFSNEENFYLNDVSNKVEDLIDYNNNKDLDLIIMKPYEIQNVNYMKQDKESLSFWRNIYSNISNRALIKYKNQVDEKTIFSAFKSYQKNIFDKNSKSVIKLLSFLPYLNLFSNIKIKLNDTGRIYNINILKGISLDKTDNFDILMHSSSLLFLLKNNFGFDTLTVNGCFDISNFDSFSKFAKFFSIGNLNNLGIYINYGVFINFNLFILFLKRLKMVRNNMLED